MKLITSSLLVASLFLLSISNSTIAVEKTCSYNPNSGKPNPLGMRTYITATAKDGNTIFVYEQFPSPVAEKITIASQRELVFYGMTIDEARKVLLQNPQYYSELVGYEDPEGFEPVNAVLSCQ